MNRRSFLAILLGSVVGVGTARETALAAPLASSSAQPVALELDDLTLEYSEKGGGHGRGHGRGRGRHRGWSIGRRPLK
jgi:hypothetical protein